MLLGLCAVGSERVRQGTLGGSRVNARSVVHGGWKRDVSANSELFGKELRGSSRVPRTRDGTLANEADQGGAESIAESDGGTHFDRGVEVELEVAVVCGVV